MNKSSEPKNILRRKGSRLDDDFSPISLSPFNIFSDAQCFFEIGGILESYLVRIYRREKDNPRLLVGGSKSLE